MYTHYMYTQRRARLSARVYLYNMGVITNILNQNLTQCHLRPPEIFSVFITCIKQDDISCYFPLTANDLHTLATK